STAPTSTLFPYTTLFRSGVAGALSSLLFEEFEIVWDLIDLRLHRRLLVSTLSKLETVSTALSHRHLRKNPKQLGNRKFVPKLLRSEEHTSELQSPDHLVC